MRTLWTLLKVVVVLAIAIPLSIVVLATALGILGAVLGLAVMALKLAVAVLVVWAVIRVAGRLLRGSPRESEPASRAELPPRDPHYEAAMRELDRDLGEASPAR